MVKIYTKRTCGYCHMAKELLGAKGIDFNEIDVSDDAEQFEMMVKETLGQRTVPQIFINNEPIGGFMELARLAQSGHLQQLLDQADA